ncbi:MAG: hypothetical protein WED04_08405 [Promethearchaeati archaeon SRVP18_Atabeyarchaeia-1]
MTLHINYDHRCPKCSAYYIPYDKDVPCPQCGVVEEERFDYIPKAAASLLFNLDNYGSYAPAAWWVSSLADHILLVLFPVFEQYRKSNHEDFDSFALDILSKSNWDEQKYLEKHVHRIAVRIYENLKDMNRTSGDGSSYYT